MARRLASRLSQRVRATASAWAAAALLMATGLGVGLAGAGLTAPAARADGDPASDALIVQKVFYPYTAPIARSRQATLNSEVAHLARDGLPLKVAIIGAPLDLGAIPELFGKPAAYARFLDTEISFNGPQPLLTVMADGFGTAALPRRLAAVAAALPRPSGRSDDALTEAAIDAVRRIATADGHPLPAGAIADARRSGASGTSPALILAVVIAVAGLVAGGILAVRRGRGRARGVRTRPGPPRSRRRRPSRGTGR